MQIQECLKKINQQGITFSKWPYKNAAAMANTIDPDQTALISVCTVC